MKKTDWMDLATRKNSNDGRNSHGGSVISDSGSDDGSVST